MDAPPRALISVYDKTGVLELAAGLIELGWELIASSGTARVIEAAGLSVIDTADYTGSPTMLGHRVVTLHPRIHGGILADRNDPSHRADLAANGIDPIDLVVVNLYPFEASPSIETIDIGGPTMVRAAAKNHAHVGVLVDPADYPAVLDELRLDGRLSAATRRRLARKAFAHTQAHDTAIVAWLDRPGSDDEVSDAGLPAVICLELERAETLRYGENPHQHGARYRQRGRLGFFDGVVQHGGPQPSYLNLMDAEAAWRLAHDLGGDRPTAVIVKHANPCGAAVASDLVAAYSRAFDCDPRSAFGGVVAVNAVIDEATADAMVAAVQADVVIAPGYSDGVIERLAARRANTRLLEAPPRTGARLGDANPQAPRWLEPIPWQVVTAREPTAAELPTPSSPGGFAPTPVRRWCWRDEIAWGIGAGQQNRVDLAAAKSAASFNDGMPRPTPAPRSSSPAGQSKRCQAAVVSVVIAPGERQFATT